MCGLVNKLSSWETGIVALTLIQVETDVCQRAVCRTTPGTC